MGETPGDDEAEKSATVSQLKVPDTPCTTELDAAILNTLHHEVGQSARTIQGSLTAAQLKELDGIEEYLDWMRKRGIITTDGKGRYLKLKESA